MDTQTLKQTRLARGLSQDKLAALSGVSQFCISNIETGKAVPNAGTRAKLEAVLGPINWLAGKGQRNYKIPRTKQALETALLKTLFDVHALPPEDRVPFLDLVQGYTEEFRSKI